MTKDKSFEVFVSDYSSSIDEWRAAQAMPKSKLPPLSEEQRHVARKMGIPEEDYRRNVFAGELGEKRLRNRGEDLGLVVEKLLSKLGAGYRLDAVKGEMINSRWLCRVETPEGIVNVAISRELVDDVLDSGATEEREKLKRHILAELGRIEGITRH